LRIKSKQNNKLERSFNYFIGLSTLGKWTSVRFRTDNPIISSKNKSKIFFVNSDKMEEWWE